MILDGTDWLLICGDCVSVLGGMVRTVMGMGKVCLWLVRGLDWK
jgi:hypothetical protein